MCYMVTYKKGKEMTWSYLNMIQHSISMANKIEIKIS